MSANQPNTAPVAAATDMTDEEKIDLAAVRILERYRPAFEELAK